MTNWARNETIVVAASNSLGKSGANLVCSGVADNVDIQIAIDALPVGGGKVTLLDGTYVIASPVNLAKYTDLSGSGSGTILQMAADSADGNRVVVMGEYSRVHDIMVDGNKTNQSGVGIHYGISSVAKTNITIERCYVKDTGTSDADSGYNVYVNGGGGTMAGEALIKDCISEGAKRENYVFFSNANDSSIVNCVARDGVDRGIVIHDSQRVLISGCKCFVNGGEGIDVVGTCYGLQITDNDIHGNTIGIQLDATALTNSNISDNLIYNNTTHGIFTNNVDKCIFEHNTFKDNVNTGIHMENSENNIIDGNHFDNNGSGGAGNEEGIAVWTRAHNNLIQNNSFNKGTHQDYCIRVLAGVNNTVIRNNDCRSFNTAWIRDDGTNTQFTNQHSDLLQDALALSVNHVVTAEDLSAGSPITCTLAAQPDVPRTFSWVLTHAQITEFTLAFVGVDAKGNDVTETVTEADGWSGELDNAFAVITSVTFTRDVGTGAGDTLNVGIADKLGLSNIIYAAGDVFKVKEDNADYTNFTIDTDFHTVSIDGVIGAGNDYTIWYKTNLNILG